MKFKIITLGCKVNQYESEMMREKLLANDYVETFDSDADVIIINTCTVTNMSDLKSRKLIRYNKRENKNAITVVCGCSAQYKQEEMEDLDIDILIGNSDKTKIVELIEEFKKSHKKYVKFISSRKLEFEDMRVNGFEHTRAYIKIEDGCNNFCAYCIIPFVRGNVRSKDMDKVIEEANTLVNNGYKEIVLTGIDTGSYGVDKNYDLTDLLIELSKIEKLERIRLSSIDIYDLTDKFINFLKENKKLCDHLHISLQSGSDKILKEMNRKYDSKEYLKIINKIRNARPNISITTDVIIGFPGETEKDFNDCVNFCKEVKFSKIHVFPYSKRNGTKASVLPNQIDSQAKKERSKKLIEVSNILENKYYNNFINKDLDILIEEMDNNESIGHTSNYIKVYVKRVLKRNDIYKVKITNISNNKVYGEIVE